jgi:hypothetical protein
MNLQREILVKTYKDNNSSTRSQGPCFNKKFSFNSLGSQTSDFNHFGVSADKDKVSSINYKVGKSLERHKRVSYDGQNYKII